jgi:hypothetical protein
MKVETISRTLITIAILMQLFYAQKNKRICSSAFFIWSFGAYMMAYDYYIKDNMQYTERVMFKLFNSTVLLLIAVFTRVK